MEFHESLGQSLVEGVAGVVGGQVEVVERGVAATTVDGDAPSVEDEANVTVTLSWVELMNASRERLRGANQSPS